MLKDDLIVSGSVDISADPSKVWNALTDPEIIKEYLFGTETLTDWEVGSEIIFQGEFESCSYKDKGVILENVLHETISYTYWSGFSGLDDSPENYCLVTYKLSGNGPQSTKLTWTQRGYASEEAHQHSASGIDAFLAQIKEIIER